MIDDSNPVPGAAPQPPAPPLAGSDGSVSPSAPPSVNRILLGRAFFSALLLAAILLVVTLLALLVFPRSSAGHVQDEAMLAGRDADSFTAAGEDYFHDMDGAVAFDPDEIKGRNNWIVWTGGNDRFWDLISTRSFGSLDLLKTVSSAPRKGDNRNNNNTRDTRWKWLGLVNEPCFETPTAPDPARFGLWLDVREGDCPRDPFEDAGKYPGVRIGARGKTVETGSFYGYPSGVVGLRLFPNPAFDDRAKKHWDPVRYYNDRRYFEDPHLVRPYRVGMSCGFCHVGPNPLNPPADPNHPEWKNLSSMVGAQYFWVDRIFAWEADQKSFVFQLFHSSKPGSLDTSLISTDNINNPRTMNAVYGLGARLEIARKLGQERLAGGNLDNKQFNDFVPADSSLAGLFRAPGTAFAPHVLKDGSDSVGALGALNRVYLNIGMFSEEWLEHFNALVGGRQTTPIEIAVARRNSSYWGANEMQTFALAKFMLKSTGPHHLKDAPGGEAFLTHDAALLTHGKEVFAERCARCHSSKLPEPPAGQDLHACSGSAYLECFGRYWQWTKTDEFRRRMKEIVLKDDFLTDNYLSTDARIPVTLLRTNACSPLATNALAGNIWDNFSSQSYKELPAVGHIQVQDPYSGKLSDFAMPGGGRGYTRVPSLISAWSTAPFLLNNSLGHFDQSPSVEARMAVFNDAIEQLLWPEKRPHDVVPGGQLQGTVDRTTSTSYLRIGEGYLPAPLNNGTRLEHAVFPWLFSEDGIRLGPIPAGTPVSLLANLDLMSDSSSSWGRLRHNLKAAGLIIQIKHRLEKLPPNASDDDARRIFADLEPKLIEFSKCPDYVVNKGHYFGTDLLGEGEPGLTDADKRALIEFIKTF